MMSRNKVSLLCRYGGNLVEESGKVSYKDGTNRMILLGAQEINYPCLLSKMLEVCKWTNVGSIKYKHPELGLDCLVSVENDEDLWNMMQAFESQNNGPIQLFVSEAQQALPIHNTIPSLIWSSNNEEISVLTEETSSERKGMTLQNNSNMDVKAETAGMPTELQVGVDEFGVDSHNLSTSKPTEHGCVSNTTIKLEEGQEFPNADVGVDSHNLSTSNPMEHGFVNNTTIKLDEGQEFPNADVGVDSHNLSTSNPTEHGGVNNTMMKLEEGQEFPNADDFHKFLREYAIRSNFEYKRYRSGHGHFAAKCIKKDCLWRIQASQISDSQPSFKIKSLKGNHTCNLDKQFKVSHYQATRKWLADFIERRNCFQSTPKDIGDAIEKEYGILVGYHKAWRGRQLAQKRKNYVGKSLQEYVSNYNNIEELCRKRKNYVGKSLQEYVSNYNNIEELCQKRKNYVGKSLQEYVSNYNNIEELCEDIRRTNPGSRVNLQGKSMDDNHLKLFISYEVAVIPVFQMACKPVVELASVKIEGKQPFVWFMAVGVDTYSIRLLLACGFMEFDHEEDMQDGYKWFCSELFNILGERILNLVFVVEYRDQGGALEVVRAIFPRSHCRYSAGSFINGICSKFDGLSSYSLSNAIETLKQSEFEECMSALYQQCPEAWEFLRSINPEYWATSHFKGACCDDPLLHLLDAEVETEFLIGLHKIRDVSVVVLVEHLHNYMMERFTERVEISSGWTTILLPRFETKTEYDSEVQILESPATTATRFRVMGVAGFSDVEDVDIHMRNCSCGAWQIFGCPCWHAEVVIKRFQLNRYEFWDGCYMADQYRKAYSMALEVIHPLPRRLEKKEWLDGILKDIFDTS